MVRLLKTNNKKAGITLLEMVFTTAGFTMVLVTMLSVYSLGLKRYQADAGQNQAIGTGMRAAVYIKQDLRNGISIEPGRGSYITDSNTVVIKAPSYNSSGIIDSSFDYIIYDVSNDTLKRTIQAASGSARANETNRPLVKGVSGLELTYTVHDFITTTGSAAFTLSAVWTSVPSCRFNGSTITSGLSYTSSNHTAYFSVPPASGAVLEFIYPVSPSNTAALSAVSEVSVSIDSEAMGSLCGNEEIGAGARLRNKR